jgi:Lysophospholipase
MKLDTFDGKKLNVFVWNEVKEAKAAVIISHGMAEHAERYDDFAKFLNKKGFVVLADDHRGHKNNPSGDKGIVDGDSFFQTVEDMKSLVEYAKTTYNLPAVLLGHSYGSFLSQRFLELYSDSIVAAVLTGTAYMKSPLISAGKLIANVQTALFGPDKTANLLNNMSFGAYNKPFEAEGHKFGWLSRDAAKVEEYEKDEYCGYPMSLGFYKAFFNGLTGMYGPAAKNIRKDFPLLIAVGSQDPVSNQSALANRLYEFYKALGLENATYKVYDGARHEILNETNRKEVYNDILKFVNKALKIEN